MEVEFQEWLRLRALPAIRKLCRMHFVQHGHPEWFKWKCYQDLCAAVGHRIDAYDPMFFISHDSDSRHGYIDRWLKLDDPTHAGPLPDRRDIPEGQPGHIPLDKHKNYVPTAPRVPDAMQFAIESIFSQVKTAYDAIIGDRTDETAEEMQRAMEEAFRKAVTPEYVLKCFKHGDGNMRIFAATEDTVVTLKGIDYHGTNGGWLTKDRRA